jgi:hypothetical protein
MKETNTNDDTSITRYHPRNRFPHLEAVRPRLVQSQRPDRSPDVAPCHPSHIEAATMSSLSKKPTTVKELKAALAALRDVDKVTVYEGDDLTKKLPAITYLKATGKTVIVL